MSIITGALVMLIMSMKNYPCIATWSIITGKTETEVEMLRSILSQLQYKHDILQWEIQGVPFCSSLYVPEDHPVTGVAFHEREDETHVFKVAYYLLLSVLIIAMYIAYCSESQEWRAP